MKRSPMKRRPKPRRVNKGKAAGTRSRVKKGPIMSEGHLDRIRKMACLVTGAEMSWDRTTGRISRVVAHHPRGLFPRTMGKRITDFLAVPLLSEEHDDFPGSLHKHGDEADWWKLKRRDPLVWLKKTLPRMYPKGHPGVEAALRAIAELTERRT